MDRRQFLRLTGVGAIAIGTSRCSAGTDYEERSLAQPELLTALGAGRVRAIGTRYRSITPGERDADRLKAAILGSRPIRARWRLGSSPPLAALIHDDFDKSRTVVLDGWILSVTEARQCALFSLLTAEH